MKLDVPDEYIPLIVTALEHYNAYARAVQRDDLRYQEAADLFKGRQPEGTPEKTGKRNDEVLGGWSPWNGDGSTEIEKKGNRSWIRF